MSSIRKQRWKSIYRNGWLVWSRQNQAQQDELIDLLVELLEAHWNHLEGKRDHLDQMFKTPGDICDLCYKPWSDHDFGVPRPECP